MGKRIIKWIVLDQDGGHYYLGEHTDPTEPEIRDAERALRNAGKGGWLAVADGSFHEPGKPPTVILNRALGEPAVSFEEAVAEFRRLRNAANAG